MSWSDNRPEEVRRIAKGAGKPADWRLASIVSAAAGYPISGGSEENVSSNRKLTLMLMKFVRTTVQHLKNAARSR